MGLHRRYRGSISVSRENHDLSFPIVPVGHDDLSKVAQIRQDPFYLVRRVAPAFQLLCQRKVFQVGQSQSPRSVSVTLPRLRLDDDRVADGTSLAKELDQTVVPVIQVDPHGDGETKDRVETAPSQFLEISRDGRIALGRKKLQVLEGDSIRTRIALARSLDEDRIEIYAEHVDVGFIAVGAPRIDAEKIVQLVRKFLRVTRERIVFFLLALRRRDREGGRKSESEKKGMERARVPASDSCCVWPYPRITADV